MPTIESEKALEAELTAKGLNAPRVTPDLVEAQIMAETYHQFPGTTLTVCVLTLKNGFQVTGESAAASPANFDAAIGKRIARDQARGKIWMLEGYLLRSMLAGRVVAKLTPGPTNGPRSVKTSLRRVVT